MYKDESDIAFIQSLLDKGPSDKVWFAAMECLEYFQHETFWNYLLDFFKKIYKHISIVNGETVPVDIQQSEQQEHASHHHSCEHGHGHAHNHDDHEEEKDDFKDNMLMMEGQDENEDENEFVDDGDVHDYAALVDESQFYHTQTQLRFIKSFCCFAMCDGLIYAEQVCASLHHLLDLNKKGTQNGYYEEQMLALLYCIPLHASMRSVVFRIFSVYGVGDWRYLNLLIHDAVQSMI